MKNKNKKIKLKLIVIEFLILQNNINRVSKSAYVSTGLPYDSYSIQLIFPTTAINKACPVE